MLATSLAVIASRPAVFAVGASVAVVGQDSGDLPGRGAATGIDDHQQFHQVVVDGAAGGLHQVDIGTPDRLLDLDVQLAIGKALAQHRAQIHAQVTRHLLSQSRVSAA
jgi:hypothetical protein